ncbi:S9 family peptidase, partial [Luminiphilus sp.]|nr:S9 family peptidase [Luminiphilus sp.]
MKFYYLTIALIATLTSCDQPTATSAGDAEHLSAAGPEPTTDRGIHVDTYFGTDVPDPYRWLEDDLSDDTSAWISQQNTSTRNFIDAISLREDVKKTVARLLNFERETAPFFAG